MKIGINLRPDRFLIELKSYCRLRFFVFLILLGAAFPLKVYSTNYFVKSSGNNNNTGLSDDQAWQTIAKVNASTFLPGDTIFFNKGDCWRESLIISSSGNESRYITFSAYGSGVAPKILGSTLVKEWSHSNGNIWYFYNDDFIDPYSLLYGGNIFFIQSDETIKWGRQKKESKQELDSEFDWTWIMDTLFIYSPTDPNTIYQGVEMAQRDYCINLNNKAYIAIESLELGYSGFYGITEGSPRTNVSGLIVRNCHIHHIGRKEYGYGIEAWHSNSLLENNEIHDSGRRNISLNIYGADIRVSNIVVESNVLYNGFHTTGIDISGFGVGTIDKVIIRNNTIFDDDNVILDQIEGFKSIGIFAEKDGVGSISNIYIYNNIIKNTTFNAIYFHDILSSYIYNNVFYGVNPNLEEAFNAFVQIAGASNCKIFNNIFYNNVNSTINPAFSCLQISSSGTIKSDYNLFYFTDPKAISCIRWVGTPKVVYSIADWEQYKKETGQDIHSPAPGNPVFVSLTDYHLTDASPAVGSGTFVGLTTDFEGKLYYNPPSIGAFEFEGRTIPEEVPVYNGSVIENDNPSIIEMSYSLPLAGIVPSSSSFSVVVNSTARSVSSVSVSGTQVRLFLSSPVAYGNTVTVAYTQPSTNQIQTPAGGQAASMEPQKVTNKVNIITPPVIPPPAKPNNPPVPIVNYPDTTYSGFIGEINAAASYDPDKDNLSYSWKVPDDIPVSTKQGPVISFLAPVIQSVTTYEFKLTISDGKTSQSSVLPIIVAPYHTYLDTAKIKAVIASDYHLSNEPEKAVDGNENTMWSSKGDEQSLILELKSLFNIKHIMVAFQPNQIKESYFDIYCSSDGEEWDLLLGKAKSCPFSGNLQVFDFPDTYFGRPYKFLKLIGLGNATDDWNYISEIKVIGFRYRFTPEYEDLPVKLYPNPTSGRINLLIEDPELKPDFIKILNIAGNVMFSDAIALDSREIQILLSLSKGVYIVQILSRNLTIHTQKLIIN